MRANGVYEPYLVVHAMSRNEYADEYSDVTYGVVVTIDYPKYAGDLYADIGKVYSKLQPLQVRPVNQILVST